jgi:hypothetical protein
MYDNWSAQMLDTPDIPIIPDKGSFFYVISPIDTFLPKPFELVQAPTLKQLQMGVQGSIELVPFWNHLYGRPCVAFCNEVGKIKNLPRNHYAHALWEASLGRIITEDYLVGNIVIIVADRKFLENL